MKIFYKFKLFIIHCSLFIILLLGAILRFYGLNWDQGHHLHPDERMITMVTMRLHFPQTGQERQNLFTSESPLNPKFFAYGSFPIYLLKFSGWFFSHFDSRWASYDWISLLGRGISGAADLGVIFLVFLLGRKIWSAKVGLLASLFYALSVFPIQASHFYAVDTLLNFFILLTLYQLIAFYGQPTVKRAILASLSFGLALATKVSATVLVAAIGTALTADLFLVLLKRLRQLRTFPAWSLSLFTTPKRQRLFSLSLFLLKYGVIIVLISGVIFIILEPFAVIDFPTFWRQTQEQQRMTYSAYIFPYTLQYVGTTPYLYQLKNLILWGMGIPLGILAVVAVLRLLIYLIKEVPRPGNENQEAKMLILLFFGLAYFLVVGKFAVKFMRYLLPLYPLLTLFSAWFIQSLIDNHRKLISLIGRIGLIFTISAALLWALAFLDIYSKSNTRVLATYWINQNIPPGAKLAIEHWDDALPLSGGEKYQFLEMPMYEPDTSDLKWQKVDNNLKEADYLILASNRLYVPLQKLADCQKYKVCYPKTAKYYESLFNGKLGFYKVAEFSSYPQFYILNFKFYINDDSADESFTVYDHPKVIIFKKNW